MSREIYRNPDRCEADDFTLNVAPYMQHYEGATPLYDIDGNVIGWAIHPMFE